MLNKKVICWDLDETLGSFKRIGYELARRDIPDFEEPTALRHGIKDLLEKLSSEGYSHFVTTSGTSDYAKEALKRTGLIGYFQEVFGRDVVSAYDGGKKYRPVADNVGLSDEQAVSNMIVIGDAPGDKPVDLDGLVFVEHRGCHHTDSYVTAMILKKLNELGDGDFKKGFEKMHQDAEIEEEKFRTFTFKRRRYDIGNGVKLKLEYRSNNIAENLGERVVPTITNIQADNYRREPLPVTQ